jgi:hypothetical protein
LQLKENILELNSKIKSLQDISSEEKAYIIELVNTKKKYGLVWEEKPEDVEEQLRSMLPVFKEVKERAIISENTDAPNHILIEGDNLHALTALSYTHEGKVDIIYIDPPYNTGKENEFRYNVMDNMFLICLSCFENEINLPDEVKLIIKTIIDDFNNDFAKGTFFYYKGLMKLSFHNDFYWKNEVQHIIRKWRKYDRRIITNLLYSHLRYFDVIKRLCLHILIGYRREICKISFSEYSSKEYGGHVKIAFGHPDLRTQAKQIAFLIFSSQNIKAPECIKEISQQIVENDIYPEWKI